MLAACLVAAGCGGTAEERRARTAPPDPEESAAASSVPRPSFVIWMVDTLRADALGCYGRPRAFTPRIDGFARESVLYDQVTASASYTRASIASLLTGLPVGLHGTARRKDTLARGLPLLSSRLQEAGYHTVAVVANPNVGSAFGFDRGWDRFEELYRRREAGPVSPQELIADGPEVARRAIEILTARPAGRPFFLFVLSVDPHGPHTPPPRYAEMHGILGPSPMDGSLRALIHFDKNPEELTPELLDRLRRLYAAEVSFADEAFGLFLDGLAALGLEESTVVAFTGDHGEEFHEHGKRGHGRTLFEESVRVPLIVRDPFSGGRGERDERPRSLLDLGATFLERAGAPPLPGGWGVDLHAADRPEGSWILTEQRQDGGWLGLREGAAKAILDLESGRQAYFDLERDPGERSALRAGDPVVGDLRERLLAAAERLTHGAPGSGERATGPEVPEEDLETLRALGYVQE